MYSNVNATLSARTCPAPDNPRARTLAAATRNLFMGTLLGNVKIFANVLRYSRTPDDRTITQARLQGKNAKKTEALLSLAGKARRASLAASQNTLHDDILLA